MEFWTAVGVIARRWYIALPGAIIVAALGVVIIGQVKPSYRASGSLVALLEGRSAAPVEGTKFVPVNPWKTVDQSSNLFAILMAQAATDQSFKAALETAGASKTYTVSPPADGSATLQIQVTAGSPDDAMESYQLVVEGLRRDAERRQALVGAPRETWVSLVDMTVPISADRQNSSKVVAAILIAAIGLLATLALAFAADSIAVARAKRRHGTGGGLPDGPAVKLPVADEPTSASTRVPISASAAFVEAPAGPAETVDADPFADSIHRDALRSAARRRNGLRATSANGSSGSEPTDLPTGV